MENKQNDTNKAFQSKISKSKENYPSTIDWNTLQKHLDNNKKNTAERSAWGFIVDQQNNSKNQKS